MNAPDWSPYVEVGRDEYERLRTARAALNTVSDLLAAAVARAEKAEAAAVKWEAEATDNLHGFALAAAERDTLRDGIQALADEADASKATWFYPPCGRRTSMVPAYALRALLNPTPEGTP